MLEVKLHWSAWPMGTQEVAENATKPPSASLQKHSLGGCTFDKPRRTAISRAYRFAARYLVEISLRNRFSTTGSQ